jgi:hypothetical protein
MRQTWTKRHNPTPAREPHLYAISLTKANLLSLRWAEQRGYFPEGWLDKLTMMEEGEFWMPEHVAWELRDAQEELGDDFLTCMPNEVFNAVMDLLNEVV